MADQFPFTVALAIILWAGLWSYATLLVMFVLMEESGSLYTYPMRLSLDRFVDTLGLGWLKTLHRMPLSERRSFSISLLVITTVGTVVFFSIGG